MSREGERESKRDRTEHRPETLLRFAEVVATLLKEREDALDHDRFRGRGREDG